MRYNVARFQALLTTICGLAGSALAQINLGTAANFGVIASSAVTNTGNTIITGSLGLYPNTESSITGFPPGRSDTIYAGNDLVAQALQDARTAYNVAGSQATTTQISADLGGQTLVNGTYTSGSAVQITGPLTLDARNDANALFVFQIGTTLTTASASSILLINGAQACNVFFQVGSSATLGSFTVFNGNILALTSISLENSATINGGLYALTGAVTLINDRIVAQQACVVEGPTSSAPATTVTSVPDVIIPTISTSVLTPAQPGTFITSTTTGTPRSTTQPTADVISIPGEQTLTTFTDGDSFTPTPPANDLTSTPPGSDVFTTLPEIGTRTTVPETVIPTTATRPTTRSLSWPLFLPNSRERPFTTPTRLATARERSTRPDRPNTRPAPSTARTSSRRATKSTSSKASIITKGYPLYTILALNSSASYQAEFQTSTQPLDAQSRLVVTSEAFDAVTTISGTPCTTLSYFEKTCSCTKTTVVPIAFTPRPSVASMDLVTVAGVPCTTTKYYEDACDCVRTSNVPIQVISASASIETTINGIPCITSKYYEPACNCIYTATIPVRIASAGETPRLAVGAERPPPAHALFSCMSACMQPEIFTMTTTSTETATETLYSTETCFITPRYRM
ncbi:hypothetical protein NX059_010756 [Plenodomus lindquistii]|nr:hypothetical protein NX059_010756 [Plenodomus lindquistii]